MTTADLDIQRPWWLRRMNSRLIGVLTVRVLGILALFAFEITVASSLGVAGYGAFSFLLATAILVSRFASLGWLNALTRLMSVYASSGKLRLLKGSVITAYATTSIGLCLSAAALGVASYSLGFFTGYEAFALILPLTAALGILELHRYALRGLDAGDIGELYPFLLLPASAAAVIWLVSVDDPQTALLIYIAVVSALVLMSIASILRRLPSGFWASGSEYRLRPWTLAALAMLVGSVGAELSARMGVLVLGGLGMDSDAGLFQAAARLALMTVFFLRVLTPVSAPRISVLFHDGRWEELRSMYWRQCGLSFAGALPFAVLFWVFPEYVLSLFGAGFENAAPILRVLSVGYLISAAAGPCGTALMMIGRERIYGVLTTISVLVTGVGCYLLAQQYGGAGAAVATTIGLVTTNALCLAVFCRAISASQRARMDPGLS